MSTTSPEIQSLIAQKYDAGFVTDIEQEQLPPGLSEDTVRFISAKKGEPEWLLTWRLKAFARWQQMKEPEWAHVHYPKIDYQAISYYAAPKSAKDAPKSLADVDPKLIETDNTLGIPLEEQKMLAGVAVDACRRQHAELREPQDCAAWVRSPDADGLRRVPAKMWQVPVQAR